MGVFLQIIVFQGTSNFNACQRNLLCYICDIEQAMRNLIKFGGIKYHLSSVKIYVPLLNIRVTV